MRSFFLFNDSEKLNFVIQLKQLVADLTLGEVSNVHFSQEDIRSLTQLLGDYFYYSLEWDVVKQEKKRNQELTTITFYNINDILFQYSIPLDGSEPKITPDAFKSSLWEKLNVMIERVFYGEHVKVSYNEDLHEEERKIFKLLNELGLSAKIINKALPYFTSINQTKLSSDELNHLTKQEKFNWIKKIISTMSFTDSISLYVDLLNWTREESRSCENLLNTILQQIVLNCVFDHGTVRYIFSPRMMAPTTGIPLECQLFADAVSRCVTINEILQKITEFQAVANSPANNGVLRSAIHRLQTMLAALIKSIELMAKIPPIVDYIPAVATLAS